MRLLVISDYRDTNAARPEAAMMLALKQRGVEVDIITFPGTDYESDFLNAGITVYHNHPQKKWDWSFIRFLKKLSHEKKYDIFYLFNSQAIINGIMAAYALPVKVLLYRGYTGHIHWYDPTAYLKYLNPRVDVVVCLADAIRVLLQKQWFFKKSKAVTINKGHDPAWYDGVIPVSLQTFNIPQHAFVVACLANARPFKGIHYLLQATYELSDLHNLHFLLIGRDMEAGSLRDLIQNSPMADRIHVTGWRSDVFSVLAASSAFVLPSITGEATTKSVIEAMSLGLAPIITDIPGNAGLVLHGKNGLVVPARNPAAITSGIRQYYENPSMVSEFGVRAREHMRNNFHIDRTVAETWQLMNQLAGNGSSDTP